MKTIQEPVVTVVQFEEIEIITTSPTEDSKPVAGFMVVSSGEKVTDDSWGF